MADTSSPATLSPTFLSDSVDEAPSLTDWIPTTDASIPSAVVDESSAVSSKLYSTSSTTTASDAATKPPRPTWAMNETLSYNVCNSGNNTATVNCCSLLDGTPTVVDAWVNCRLDTSVVMRNWSKCLSETDNKTIIPYSCVSVLRDGESSTLSKSSSRPRLKLSGALVLAVALAAVLM